VSNNIVITFIIAVKELTIKNQKTLSLRDTTAVADIYPEGKFIFKLSAIDYVPSKDVKVRTDVLFDNYASKILVDKNEEKVYCYRGGVALYDRVKQSIVYQRTTQEVGDLNFISLSPNEKLLLLAVNEGPSPLLIVDSGTGEPLFTMSNKEIRFPTYGRCGFISDDTFFALNGSQIAIFELSDNSIKLKVSCDN